jgi:uncharacterized protein YgiM (DUF1202 family)
MNMETGGFGGDDRRKYIVPALIVAAALVVLLLILGIGAIIRSRGTGANATATVTRTATRGVIIGGSPTAATRTTAAPSTGTSPRPSTAPSTAPSAAPAAAASYVVANTGGDNINMRSSASASAEIVARLAEGDQIVEIGPVATADGREWRHVRTKDGIEGWVASEFTAPAP